jgi:hypothetical protein
MIGCAGCACQRQERYSCDQKGAQRHFGILLLVCVTLPPFVNGTEHQRPRVIPLQSQKRSRRTVVDPLPPERLSVSIVQKVPPGKVGGDTALVAALSVHEAVLSPGTRPRLADAWPAQVDLDGEARFGVLTGAIAISGAGHAPIEARASAQRKPRRGDGGASCVLRGNMACLGAPPCCSGAIRAAMQIIRQPGSAARGD